MIFFKNGYHKNACFFNKIYTFFINRVRLEAGGQDLQDHQDLRRRRPGEYNYRR